MIKRLALFAGLLSTVVLLVIACQPVTENRPTETGGTATMPAELKSGLDTITTADLMQHTKALSADEYEGRGPGTKGEELTVKYLTEQFQRLGLKPGNPDGTYVQKVPLAGFTAQPTASFTAGDKKIDLKFPEDYVAVSRRFVAAVES